MAKTSKLDVGKALDKLRGTDLPKSKMTRLDENIDALDQEIQRLRAARRLSNGTNEPARSSAIKISGRRAFLSLRGST